jgi:hypothetical protein
VPGREEPAFGKAAPVVGGLAQIHVDDACHGIYALRVSTEEARILAARAAAVLGFHAQRVFGAET